jgi:hypothetical protein
MTEIKSLARIPARVASASRSRVALTSWLCMMLGGSVPVAAQPRDAESAPIEAVLQRDGIGSVGSGRRVVAAWNELAHDIAFAEDQFLTFKGQRALAMMHLAMHDAINSIVPVYRRYAYAGPLVIAHPVAAAAQGAHEVLLSQYPDQQRRLAAELAVWLGPIAGSPLRERGIGVGRAAAAAILERRADDGWDLPGSYEFRNGAGQYQTTPPWNGFVAQPGFRFAKPFAPVVHTRLRPAPPPPLAGARYARAFPGSQGVRRGRQHTAQRRSDCLRCLVDGIRGRLGEPPGQAPRRRPARAPMGLRPAVRASRHIALRRVHRDLGLEVRVQPLAPLYGHSRGRHRRQPAHCRGSRLGAAPPDAAVPRVRIGARHGVRRLLRSPGACVWRAPGVHDGDDDGPAWQADPFVRQLSRGGEGVRRLTRAAGLALPVCDRRRSRAWSRHRSAHDSHVSARAGRTWPRRRQVGSSCYS